MYKFSQLINIQEAQLIPISLSAKGLTHIPNMLQLKAPFISIKEVNDFRQLVARAAIGDCFLINTGDYAQSFFESDEYTDNAKLDFIQQLAEFFYKKTGHNLIKIGHIAEQFQKPAYNLNEIEDNNESNSLFDEGNNQFQENHSIFDSRHMLLDYKYVASVYRKIKKWNRKLQPKTKIYTSQEVRFPHYEQALTRFDNQSGLYYNLATHFPCVGQHSVGNVEHTNYLKKIANPLAMKVGPNTCIKKLIETINKLDPEYVPGRITLIPQLGAKYVHRILPELIEAVKKTQHTVLWSCDPMHGNINKISSGIIITKLSNIVEEIKSSFSIHRKMGGKLNAINLDATHHEVSECINYESHLCNSVDDFTIDCQSVLSPRLNYEQMVHVMQNITKHYIEFS